MKKVLFIVALVSFGIWGCSENTNLTGPQKSETQQSFLKVATNNSSILMKTSVSETIDGDIGGLIRINLESADEEFGAKGTLYFSEDSFEGIKVISISIAEGLAALDFGPPETNFDSPASLTLKFNGIDFGDDDGEVDFQYMDGGELFTVDYRKLIVNRKHGWVMVIDAKLDHFSRYGFTK